MTRILFLFLIIVYTASCSSSRKVQNIPVQNDTTVIPEIENPNDSAAVISLIYQNIIKQSIAFDNFSARVNVDFKDDKGQQQNVNVYLRMKQDSVIWFSVNAVFGIEVMRVMITPDSVKLLDKANKIYLERPITYLYEMTGLPLNFYTMQDLLIGNPIFLGPDIVTYSITPNEISLLSFGRFFKNLSLFDDKNFKVKHSRLDDRVHPDRYAVLGYADYEFMDHLFSKKRNILVNDEKKIELILEFKQIDFKELLTFPFSIPKNYTAN